MKNRIVVLSLVVGPTVLCAAAGHWLDVPTARAAEPDPSRYPFDPVCPWGRLANGKGLFVRCVTETEAATLASASPAAASPPPAGSGTRLEVSVGPVLADQGKLPVAEKKLAVPKDRYAECVTKNGGLQGNLGEVHVRFMVAARGRAEGVSVAKRSGMSETAARCIADVVDRRPVGTPEVEMMGATVVVKVRAVP
jgi:hypothetical protein